MQSQSGRRITAFQMGGGLYLFVLETGGKLWQYRYRVKEGDKAKEKLMALGKYPDVSLSEARQKHLAARKLLAGGVDPMEQRKADKLAAKVAEEHSFQSIALQWHENWQVGKSPRHADVGL